MDQPEGTAPRTRPIGSAGQPIRTIAFSSGGFDTAMDLGVIHALLVIQGKAPDAVVGISAGAINAVALAEILQREAPNGSAATPEETRRAKVARFREIFEAYANAPTELAAAYFPDTLQVDAGRSLEPLRLPIHNHRERLGRQSELKARQGFIRFFNFMLRTRFSFATLTRFVRRILGLQAAGQIRSRGARIAIYLFELVRSWSLIGLNLHRIAELMLETVWRPLFRAGGSARGSTAAGVLFARRWFRSVRIAVGYFSTFLTLTALWLSITALPIVGAWAFGGWIAGRPQEQQIAVAAGLAALLAIGIYRFERAGVWRQLTLTERNPRLRLVGELALESFELVGLAVLYLGIPLALLWVVSFALSGFALAEAGRLMVEAIWRGWWIVPLAGFGAALVIAVRFWQVGGDYRRRFLEQFDLTDALLSKHPIRDLFVRLFDPEYYGPRNMDDVVERSLRSEDQPSETSPTRKVIGEYAAPGKREQIEVGLIVANVGTGELEIVDPGVSVVDGLYASVAVAPLLPPAEATGRLFVDGGNITSEPTSGALALLRGRTHPDAPVIHIYSVSPLPFSSPTLREENGTDAPVFLNLVDVARRALLLQRFRDASLERRLTELYTRTMPPGRAAQSYGGNSFLRAWVTPVEPDQPLELHQRLFEARTKEAKREVIAEAVAEGCRAALQVMTRASQPPSVADPQNEQTLPCRQVVTNHLQRSVKAPLPLLADFDRENPPPTGEQASGLPEVCRHCRLREKGQGAGASPLTYHRLHFRKWAKVGPAWPHRDAEPEPLLQDDHFQRQPSAYAARTEKSLANYRVALDRGTDQQPRWPRTREGHEGKARPTVSLLFSGGVFRGVYQLGTLNALSELGLRPDVVAGASVGSITSAMIAQALSHSGAERQLRIARLAATYLALDRLILTDRFADFVRGLTLRAGATRFSLSEADRFFRRYDQAAPGRHNREARRVIAGLERLFWLSPFELHGLVRALRLGDTNQISRQLKDYVQEWLERMGVGREVLGSEPLSLLVAEHVLQALPGEAAPVDLRAEPFDRFLKQGIYFLATTTNLSMGRLEMLGEQQFMSDGPRPVLLDGLLASSAFPAVFRPRWAWEVMPGSNAKHQYIDGGVMDNLPLDGVAHFLRNAAAAGLIHPHPTRGNLKVPHLLFSASLEPVVRRHTTIDGVEPFRRDWVALMQRTGQLRYNKKVELYGQTQQALRQIRAEREPGAEFTPIDLEVVTVKPQWLVSTFAFHPMLGFRRSTQAESIAHGCATTLAVFSDLQRDPEREPWLGPWGVLLDAIPQSVERKDGALVPGPGGGPGTCWFRADRPCPFSRKSLEALPAPGLPPATVTELDGIYRACGREATHRARTGGES
ncbi:MAG: hypothetical protein HOP28_11890 [Gemmatimonadales bacterium]|nr:hypothetical protein [Gemmatimonadales bacterium]